VRIFKSGLRLWLAAGFTLAVAASAQTQSLATAPAATRPAAAAAANAAWPTEAVANPATLGFSAAGLEALDPA
jgi:hypothetical protein